MYYNRSYSDEVFLLLRTQLFWTFSGWLLPFKKFLKFSATSISWTMCVQKFIVWEWKFSQVYLFIELSKQNGKKWKSISTKRKTSQQNRKKICKLLTKYFKQMIFKHLNHTPYFNCAINCLLIPCHVSSHFVSYTSHYCRRYSMSTYWVRMDNIVYQVWSKPDRECTCLRFIIHISHFFIWQLFNYQS